MADITKIQIGGTDYDIKDDALTTTVETMSETLANVTDTDNVVTSDLVTQVVANTASIESLSTSDGILDASTYETVEEQIDNINDNLFNETTTTATTTLLDLYTIDSDGTIATTTTSYHRIRYIAVSKGDDVRFVATTKYSLTVVVAMYSDVPAEGSTSIDGTRVISETGTSFDITYRALYDGYIAIYAYRLGTSTFTSTSFYHITHTSRIQDLIDEQIGDFGTFTDVTSEMTTGYYIAGDPDIGDTMDVETLTSKSNGLYGIFDVTDCDAIVLSARSGAGNTITIVFQPFVFLDDDNVVISKCWDYTTYFQTIYHRMVTVPSGATKVLVNTLSTISYYVKKYVKPTGFPVASVSITNYGAVSDGTTDCSDAIQLALSSGAKSVYIPEGEYIISRNMYIPDGVSMYGDGNNKSKIILTILTSGRVISEFAWRSSALTPVLMTEYGSSDITFRDFAVEGDGTYNDGRRVVAFAVFNTENCKIINCATRSINYDTSTRTNVTAHIEWGMSVYILYSSNVIVDGGEFIEGGYENLGTEFSDHVVIQNAYFGDAWRVSVQIHMGSTDIVFQNNTIKQNCSLSQSAMMLHGRPEDYELGDSRVMHIFINNNYIYGRTDGTTSLRGGITFVYGNEHDIHLNNNYIDSDHYALADAGEGSSYAGTPTNWYINNNTIVSSAQGIYLSRNENIFIKDNIIDATSTAINVTATNYVVEKNILLTDTTMTLSGTEWAD